MRRPSWLVSSTVPSATRKSASLARLQVENGRPCSAGLDLAISLILPAFREGQSSRPAAFVLRVERLEAVGAEVVDHVPDPVRAGERHLGDLPHGLALRG
ncbi:hypothetical protein ADK64_37005 [Streptomyces sp. MMG1121]|nr:hypothetical protein ADK64_37005 [Streptomyces sp. MMG1121]